MTSIQKLQILKELKKCPKAKYVYEYKVGIDRICVCLLFNPPGKGARKWKHGLPLCILMLEKEPGADFRDQCLTVKQFKKL